MDPFSTTVIGSRYPFTYTIAAEPPSKVEQPARPPLDVLSKVSLPVSRIRRKQLTTFQSPSAVGSATLRIEADSDRHNESLITSSATSSSSSTSNSYAHIKTDHASRTAPPLPLYHPQGRLALSLPELDPGVFGLPSSVNIEDNDVRVHVSPQETEASRRSSSRARRPAAKLREVGASAGLGDADEVHDALAALNGRKPQNGDAQGQARSVSPRKRRAGGAGAVGGAGGKRRRKEVDDGDGTYPNPIGRRTRNPRGAAAAAAVASPLAGPALIAHGEAEEAEGEGEEGNAPAEAAQAEAARPTRARRSRVPAARRRNSSASETTTTSVSVSIATNARGTRSAANKKTSEGEAPINEDTFEALQQLENKQEETESAGSAENNHDAPVPTQTQEDDAVESPADVSMETVTEKAVEIPEKVTAEREEAQHEPSRHEDGMDITVPAAAGIAGDANTSDNHEPSPKSPPVEEAKMEVDSELKADKTPESKVPEPEKAPQPSSTTSHTLITRPPSVPSAPTASPPAVEAVRVPLLTRPPPVSVLLKPSVADDEKEEGELSDE